MVNQLEHHLTNVFWQLYLDLDLSYLINLDALVCHFQALCDECIKSAGHLDLLTVSSAPARSNTVLLKNKAQYH